MDDNKDLLICYHKGCGKKFDPKNNTEDACRYHPGEPFFHDAYKGWSCCNVKCIDFTDFLNIPGCTVSHHSNEKPVEIEKPTKQIYPDEVIESKPPSLPRPLFDTPLVTLTPEIASSLKNQKLVQKCIVTETNESSITVGTMCKNAGCTKSYEGPHSDLETCVYHSGVPIFHEGLKYWSCCQRKTSDFNAFLNQEGCMRSTHLWKKKNGEISTVDCRWDWHQTGNCVIFTIYAKQYCPYKSNIQVNPIRIKVDILFPDKDNSFKLDLELEGIVDVEKTTCCMFGTKIEVKLKKAEAKSWSKFSIPKNVEKKLEQAEKKEDQLTPLVEAVDLNDL